MVCVSYNVPSLLVVYNLIPELLQLDLKGGVLKRGRTYIKETYARKLIGTIYA